MAGVVKEEASANNPFKKKESVSKTLVTACLVYGMSLKEIGELTEQQYLSMMSNMYVCQSNLYSNQLLSGLAGL